MNPAVMAGISAVISLLLFVALFWIVARPVVVVWWRESGCISGCAALNLSHWGAIRQMTEIESYISEKGEIDNLAITSIQMAGFHAFGVSFRWL